MKQVKIFFLLLVIVLVAGCATLRSFRSDIATRDYMVGLLPASSDFFAYFNFREMDENNFLMEVLSTAINENKDIRDFFTDCDIDWNKDIYSIAMAVEKFSLDTEDMSQNISMIFNLDYNRNKIIQRLINDGYSEEEDNPWQVPFFTNRNNETVAWIGFLSDSLILLASENTADLILHQHYRGVKPKKHPPLITTLREVQDDAPFIFGMRNFSNLLETALEDNPVGIIFNDINEAAMTMNYTETDLMIEMIVYIEDETQRETLHALLLLGIQSSMDTDEESTSELLEYMHISKSDEGIKLSIEIPLLEVFDLINEHDGTFL